MMPQLIANFEPIYQAKYLCFTARSIQLGLFSDEELIVLPTPKHGHEMTVYFPNWAYSQDFWRALQTLAGQPSSSITRVDMADWHEIVQKFLDQLQDVLQSEHLIHRLAEIVVIPTLFGTAGSFSAGTSAAHPTTEQLICTYRVDLPISYLCKTILLGVISTTQAGYSDLTTPGYTDRKIIGELLAKHDTLQIFLPRLRSKQLSVSERLQSKQYLAALGYPEAPFSLSTIYPQLSFSERKLLKQLEEKAGTIVSFDEVAAVLWGDETYTKFSLYALSAVIKSLRQKLLKAGCRREVICTVRKKGYIYLP
jgi:hypothetical protein